MSRLDLTRWLVGHTRRLLPPLAVSVAARIASQLLGVALLVLAATALVRAAAGEPVAVAPMILWLVGIALAKALLRYLEHYAGHWVAFTALQRLRELLFARLVPQAPAATQGRAGAELTARATRDIDRVEVFFAHTLPPAVSAIVVPSAALCWLAAAVDGRLALTLAPFVVVTLCVPLVAASATWRSAQRIAAARGAIAAHVGDDINGTREVLALGAQGARLGALDRADRDLMAARAASGRIQALRAGTTVLLQGLSLVAIGLVGVGLGVGVEATAVALAVGAALWGPTKGVDDFATSLDASFAAAARVRRIIDGRPVVVDPAVPAPAPIGGDIEVRDVTLRSANRTVLDGVSARFAAGEWSFVVGVSGSGKSTLASMLLRARDPEGGSITLGGVDLRSVTLGDLRTRLGIVSQRPTTLTGSVADNLRLAAPDATGDELHAALADAALDDWVASLPQGIDTPVRGRGLALSGGQLQRLALARALVAAPDVLILDEALSQLDGATAERVRERLRALRDALTVIEITHRADLVPDEAAVTVLDAGRVVEAGAAGTLRAAGGAFAHLEARV